MDFVVQQIDLSKKEHSISQVAFMAISAAQD